MVDLYCKLIIEGRKTIDDVPIKIREKVRERLAELTN
jgi:hypothetical protein